MMHLLKVFVSELNGEATKIMKGIIDSKDKQLSATQTGSHGHAT